MALCYSITENLSIFKHFLTMFLTVTNDMLSFKSNTYAINIFYIKFQLILKRLCKILRKSKGTKILSYIKII